jgi:hypothetical protein
MANYWEPTDAECDARMGRRTRQGGNGLAIVKPWTVHRLEGLEPGQSFAFYRSNWMPIDNEVDEAKIADLELHAWPSPEKNTKPFCYGVWVDAEVGWHGKGLVAFGYADTLESAKQKAEDVLRGALQ